MYCIKKDELIKNFSRCKNWKEKYLYIIEIGESLPNKKNIREDKNLIHGCQSRVWIKLEVNRKKFQLLGDSDSSIVKGLIAIIFIHFRESDIENISCKENKKELKSLFKRLSLYQNLTPSRVKGTEFIIQFIYLNLQTLLKKIYKK